MLSHSWMARDELNRGYIDSLNDKFETILERDNVVRKNFILKEFRIYKERVKSYVRVETAYLSLLFSTIFVFIYLTVVFIKKRRNSRRI